MARRVAGVVVAAVAVLGVGCGGSGSDETSYKDGAQAVCREVGAELKQLEAKYSDTDDQAERQRLAAEVGRAANRRVTELLALDPDTDAEKTLVELLGRGKEIAARYASKPDDATRKELVEIGEDVEAALKEAGLTECLEARSATQ